MALAGQGRPGRQDRAFQARGLREGLAGIRAAHRAALTALSLLAAGPALALSCTPWSHLHAWAAAQASDQLVLIVKGELVFDEGQLPVVDPERQDDTPPLTRIDGFFGGTQLGRNGFQRPWAEPVTVEIACFGPWCGGLRPGEMIAFIEMREGAFVLTSEPCGGNAFPVTDEIARELTRCMQGRGCKPKNF